jgi:betaine-aldehyde dehydrogenase
VAVHWIDGTWVDSDEHRESVNPATGETISKLGDGQREGALQAIGAAKRAFADPTWRTDRRLRARVLNRMADPFEERADELVELLGLENGKTHDQGALEVAFAPETLRFNAALALTDTGTTARSARASSAWWCASRSGWRGSSRRGTRRLRSASARSGRRSPPAARR